MRRLVLARISSLTTPAGRCVARTRWIPRLRPRWATPTSAGRKPGRSAAIAANSSMTTTSRGSGRLVPPHRPVGVEVVGADLSEQPLATADLRLEADQRALGETVVEVGDDADRVRQVGAGVERRAALVVDEHERHVVRAAPGGQRHHQGAQQLTLAGARRAGDQGVRAVADEIDLDDAVGGHADRGAGMAVARRLGGRIGTRRATRRRWRSSRRSRRGRLAASSRESATDVGQAPAASSGSSGSWIRASRRAASSATATDSPAA